MTSDGPKPRPAVSAAYLDRAAVFYLQRYASSAENLRRVLLRKARRRASPDEPPGPELVALIAAAVERAVGAGLLDDRLYAEAKLASLVRRGASPRAIRARLHGKGVPETAIAAALDADPPDEIALARRFAERRRLGPWRRTGTAEARDKDIAAMGRAGFSYGVARTVLDEPDRS